MGDNSGANTKSEQSTDGDCAAGISITVIGDKRISTEGVRRWGEDEEEDMVIGEDGTMIGCMRVPTIRGERRQLDAGPKGSTATVMKSGEWWRLCVEVSRSIDN